MDIFSREQADLVPAFAGRLLLAIGKGLRTARASMKALILSQPVEHLWGLGLLLVRSAERDLPRDEAAQVQEALGSVEVGPVWMAMNLMRERLAGFLREAHDAQHDGQLAMAGARFFSAVTEIGSLFAEAVAGDQVMELSRTLVTRVPLPTDVEALYLAEVRAPTEKPDVARARLAEAKPVVDAIVRTTARTHAPQVPVPKLAGEEITRAYLLSLGWQAGQVDRFLAGPGQGG